MNPKALIVFDMDGVLINVSKSYRETVRQTARLFFRGAYGWADLPDPLFPLSDLARIKQGGGLNNDWDLTFLVISLLYSRVKGPQKAAGTDAWAGYREGMAHCDVSGLARFLKEETRPLTGLLGAIGKPSFDFLRACYRGDVGSGNVIKQIFQEIYLGPSLFRTIYGFSPGLYQERGYIDRESLLIDPALLARLGLRHFLAIATGRPKAEADHPLDRFDIRKFFSAVYTLDDCLKEERLRLETGKKPILLSKPDPFMLDAIGAAFEKKVSRCYYIGDMPDDMASAARSRFPYSGIGILISSPDKTGLAQALQKAGAAEIVESFDALEALMDSKAL